MKSVDVAIIGAGSAGLSARREVAKVTGSYLVIESGQLGTTCARVGCMPSKVLIQVAQDFDRRKKFAEQGIAGADGLVIDLSLVMQHVRKLRDRFVRGVVSDMEDWQGDKLIHGRAHFLGPNLLEVNGEKIQAKSIIIASGSKPVVVPALSAVQKFVYDSDSFFELPTLPSSVAVIGLGVIGLELGLALAKLGVKVYGLQRNPQSLAGITDPKVREYALKAFEKYLEILPGESKFMTDESPERGVPPVKILTAGGRTVKVEMVLNTAGRKPVLTGLDLERIGIHCKPDQVPEFDPHTYELKEAQGVFLVGDVNGQRPVLHEASDEGRIAGYNASRIGGARTEFLRRTQLSVVFSHPEICSVGETYRTLMAIKRDFVFSEVSFEGQGRAIVMLEECGYGHLYADTHSGIFLGAELMAPHADHLAHLLAWAIEKRSTVFEILSFPFYHPVLEEGLRTGFRSLARMLKATSPELEVRKRSSLFLESN